MSFAVFKARFTRTAEKHKAWGVETNQFIHEVELSQAQALDATDAASAIQEAKALGFRTPIVGEVA